MDFVTSISDHESSELLGFFSFLRRLLSSFVCAAFDSGSSFGEVLAEGTEYGEGGADSDSKDTVTHGDAGGGGSGMTVRVSFLSGGGCAGSMGGISSRFTSGGFFMARWSK